MSEEFKQLLNLTPELLDNSLYQRLKNNTRNNVPLDDIKYRIYINKVILIINYVYLNIGTLLKYQYSSEYDITKYWTEVILYINTTYRVNDNSTIRDLRNNITHNVQYNNSINNNNILRDIINIKLIIERLRNNIIKTNIAIDEKLLSEYRAFMDFFIVSEREEKMPTLVEFIVQNKNALVNINNQYSSTLKYNPNSKAYHNKIGTFNTNLKEWYNKDKKYNKKNIINTNSSIITIDVVKSLTNNTYTELIKNIDQIANIKNQIIIIDHEINNSINLLNFTHDIIHNIHYIGNYNINEINILPYNGLTLENLSLLDLNILRYKLIDSVVYINQGLYELFISQDFYNNVEYYQVMSIFSKYEETEKFTVEHFKNIINYRHMIVHGEMNKNINYYKNVIVTLYNMCTKINNYILANGMTNINPLIIKGYNNILAGYNNLLKYFDISNILAGDFNLLEYFDISDIPSSNIPSFIPHYSIPSFSNIPSSNRHYSSTYYPNIPSYNRHYSSAYYPNASSSNTPYPNTSPPTSLGKRREDRPSENETNAKQRRY